MVGGESGSEPGSEWEGSRGRWTNTRPRRNSAWIRLGRCTGEEGLFCGLSDDARGNGGDRRKTDTKHGGL